MTDSIARRNAAIGTVGAAAGKENGGHPVDDKLNEAEADTNRLFVIWYVDKQFCIRAVLTLLNRAVPASSDKFLQKSLTSTSPTITYDLEDSIHPSFKESARSNLISFLRSFPSDNAARSFDGLSVAVRPNSPFTPVDEYASMDEQERLKEGEEGWGMRDIPDVWGSEGARRFNKGAGPMMLLPKVSDTRDDR